MMSTHVVNYKTQSPWYVWFMKVNEYHILKLLLLFLVLKQFLLHIAFWLHSTLIKIHLYLTNEIKGPHRHHLFFQCRVQDQVGLRLGHSSLCKIKAWVMCYVCGYVQSII